MKYSEEIPQEVVQIIESLEDPIRRAILVLLNKSNELSFSDIEKGLGLNKLTLNYHLKNLYSAGLADHYFRHEIGNQKYSYYAITSLGKRVLTNLINALIPTVPFQRTLEEGTYIKKYNSVSEALEVCSLNYWESNRKKILVGVTPCNIITESREASYATDNAKYTKAE
jgi:DNA-binding transcriptional ArsR family regulator